MRILAGGKAYRVKLAQEAYNLAVRKYSWDVVANRYFRVFQDLMGEN